MEETENSDELFRQYQKASENERRMIETRICEEYAPLVNKVVSKYGRQSSSPAASFEDRIQDGFRGLLTALRTYDSSIGASFLTYAFSCVQKAVYSGICEINTGGRAKTYSSLKVREYRRIKKELGKKLGRNPSVSELSAETGWRINTVLAYERQLHDAVSIEDTELPDISI